MAQRVGVDEQDGGALVDPAAVVEPGAHGLQELGAEIAVSFERLDVAGAEETADLGLGEDGSQERNVGEANQSTR